MTQTVAATKCLRNLPRFLICLRKTLLGVSLSLPFPTGVYCCGSIVDLRVIIVILVTHTLIITVLLIRMSHKSFVNTHVPETAVGGIHYAETTWDRGHNVTNREFNCRVCKGTQSGNKRLNTLHYSAPSAVIFLARKYRIAIGRLINIPE